MSTLRVANVHFESTGSNRIDYTNDDIIRIVGGATKLPVGTVGTRPFGEVGLIRFNTDSGGFEGHNGSSWGAIGGAVDLSAPFNTANSAFLNANSAFLNANAAFLNANSAFLNANAAFLNANAAFLKGNTAHLTANSAFLKGNTAHLTANAAFDKANTAGGGATILIDAVNATRYVTFANNTTGVFSQANVATSLTFNPSTGTLSATIFNSTSDENKKTNITTIDNALDVVNSLRGVSFNWKDTGRPSYGLVAQEVEKYIPELVDTDEDDNKTLNYDAVIGFLVEAIKELSKTRND
jgi:hypothetical protein